MFEEDLGGFRGERTVLESGRGVDGGLRAVLGGRRETAGRVRVGFARRYGFKLATVIKICVSLT